MNKNSREAESKGVKKLRESKTRNRKVEGIKKK